MYFFLTAANEGWFKSAAQWILGQAGWVILAAVVVMGLVGWLSRRMMTVFSSIIVGGILAMFAFGGESFLKVSPIPSK